MSTSSDKLNFWDKNKALILMVMILVPMSVVIYNGYKDLDETIGSVGEEHTFLSDRYIDVDPVGIDHPRFELLLRAALEQDVVKLRNKRVESSKVSRIWTRFVSILLGAISLTIGACFVLAQIASPKFVANLEANGIKASVASSSPGIILAVCGVVLMVVPNVSSQRITTNDSTAYLTAPYYYNADISTTGNIELDATRAFCNDFPEAKECTQSTAED